MRIHIWCFLVLVFLVSVKAGIHDHVAQSFYESPQSSSPSPLPKITQFPPTEELQGNKEIVLFLTPDQVNALQAAGAVVQPFPEGEVDLTQQQPQLPQNIEQRNKQQYQTQWNPIENLKLKTEIQNYYKLLNIQEINDSLSQTTKTAEEITERTTTTPRYRFTTSRPRYKEREYSTPAVPQRKASRNKISNQSSNSEYVRFQYNYENGNLKNTPHNALPLSPYQPEKNKEIQRNDHYRPITEAHQNAFSGATVFARQNIYTAQSKAYTEAKTEPQQKASTVAQPITHSKVNRYSARSSYKPTVPARVQVAEESVRPQALVEVPPPYWTQTPATVQKLRVQDTPKYKEPPSSIRSFPPRQEEQKTQVTPALPLTINTAFANKDKLSLLLAPLYQHHVISKIEAQQKDDLLRSESSIDSKLQQLIKSPQYFNPQNKYTADIDKNYAKSIQQNTLAKFNVTTKFPTDFINKNSEISDSKPIHLIKTSEFPIRKYTSKPQDLNISSPKPDPVELSRQFPAEVEKSVERIKNVYVRTEKPYTKQTIAPLRLKHTTPESLPFNDPDSPIFRPIWEH